MRIKQPAPTETLLNEASHEMASFVGDAARAIRELQNHNAKLVAAIETIARSLPADQQRDIREHLK